MSIFKRIEAGDLKPKGFYPIRPAKPLLLRLTDNELTARERRMLPKAQRDYEAAVAAVEQARAAWQADESRLEGEFRKALFAECSVGNCTEFAEAMYGIAYQSGHGSGLADVASAFMDLMPLLELYRKAKEGKA